MLRGWLAPLSWTDAAIDTIALVVLFVLLILTIAMVVKGEFTVVDHSLDPDRWY